MGDAPTGRQGALTVAAAQPACMPLDVAANARAHARAVRAARARVTVFPELSLTGYELDAPPVEVDDPALAPLVRACAETGSLVLAGAPTADDHGNRYLSMLAIDGIAARVVHHKTWLGGVEPERFAAGDGPNVVDVDGWRLGLGICKDTGASQHTVATADLGIDVYVAGLTHRPEELPEQEARAVVIARTCRAYVVFASFAGATGDVFAQTAGHSAVWSPEGVALARAGHEVGEIACSTLR